MRVYHKQLEEINKSRDVCWWSNNFCDISSLNRGGDQVFICISQTAQIKTAAEQKLLFRCV